MPGDFIVFEDADLLVIHKPAGWNTHAPSPFAGEGLYEWLKNREPRWATLAIIHRLDKETSGLIVFGKTPEANRSLTAQFTVRSVHKRYVLLTDRAVDFKTLDAKSNLTRAGDKYISRSNLKGGEMAETRFRLSHELIGLPQVATTARLNLIEAEPLTGRTHQIRVHAAEHGFPILGDTLYGGSPAPRLCLHATELQFEHPVTRETLRFAAPPDFAATPAVALRDALMDRRDQTRGSGTGSTGDSPVPVGEPPTGTGETSVAQCDCVLPMCIPQPSARPVARRDRQVASATVTNACRLIHGAADGWPGLCVERAGDFLVAESAGPLTAPQTELLHHCVQAQGLRGAYHKRTPRAHRPSGPDASPIHLFGDAAPGEILVRENGLAFSLRFNEGSSIGLFLDQRDNRRRWLTNYIAPGFRISESTAGLPLQDLEVLNTFAYTCSFSVCAARAGAHVTSLDLSRKYLEWGQRNFVLNGLDPAAHDFIFGDCFSWLRRLARKQRVFDAILLDPPTFSRSKESGVFQAEKDFGKLVAAALPLLKPNGLLFASSNAARWEPQQFMEELHASIAAGRNVTQEHYVPQPPDIPITRDEPAYLKTAWMRVR